MSVFEKIDALVRPHGMHAEQYIQLVITHHGYIGLAKGITVLPPNTLDAEEYIRVMEENKRQLQLGEQSEKQLVELLEKIGPVPLNHKGMYYGRFQTRGSVEQNLSNVRNEMKRTYNYIFGLIKNTRIIDGKAFEAEMSTLLIKYVNELMLEKEHEAMRIADQRAAGNAPAAD